MKRYSNFTLIELVVAIAILTMVAGIVGFAGAAFYDGYKRSVQVTNKLKQYMAIDNLMDTHIRNMIPFKWKDDEGTSRLVFNGEEDQIHFTTLRRSYGDKPEALLFVRVFVEEEKLVAEYSNYPRLPWLEEGDENMPYTREVIAENVRQVTFLYGENSTEQEYAVEFLETFLEEENSVLPLAVMMKIEFTDGSTEQWLRRVAGVSRNSTFGYRDAQSSSDTDSAAQASPRSSSGSSRSGTSGSRRSGGMGGGMGGPRRGGGMGGTRSTGGAGR